MTLTPSARAISPCSFPCVARSFACASFEPISTLECLFFLAIAVSLRSANVMFRILSWRLKRTLQGPYKDLTRTLQGNAVFPCRFRKYVRKRTDWGLPKKTDRDWRLQKNPRTDGNLCCDAQLTHS